MPALAEKQLEVVHPLAWILNNDFVNENGDQLEFDSHRFLVRPYADDHPDQVIMKSAQIGWSTLAILKTFHLAKYRGLNCIYTLPTRNATKDFVFPKVNPLILRNKSIRDIVTQDSITLKQVGDRFIYYKGSFSETEAIMISADLLVNDELDRSDQRVLNTYLSRLGASKYGWKWRFSNPSVPGFGVHALWENSDQMHWFVTCSHCKHETFMAFEEAEGNAMKPHFLDITDKLYKCGKCLKTVSDSARQSGRWIAKYPDRSMRGYHVSQLMAPWISPAKIVSEFESGTPDYFHNFVLGLPYIAAELVVDRETILRATTPGEVAMTDVVIGVDNGVTKHYVIGTPSGIVYYGKTDSWEEIEGLLNLHNAIMVIDANPYPNVPRQLARKYRGRVFMNHYIPDTKNLGTVQWGDGKNYGMVKADRTRVIDLVASEINSGIQMFMMNPSDMEGYISHWTSMYRSNETNNAGITKGAWITKENKPDHWAHATVYFRIGLEKVMKGRSGGVRPVAPSAPLKGVLVNHDRQTIETPVDIMKIARESGKPRKDWRR